MTKLLTPIKTTVTPKTGNTKGNKLQEIGFTKLEIEVS
jgi:hypothetical protein